MPLPGNFHFSQNNLQDFVDCARRFELRHLLKLAWPAPQTEPVLQAEQDMLLGNQFHHLIHQHQIGLAAETLLPGDLSFAELVAGIPGLCTSPASGRITRIYPHALWHPPADCQV